MSFFEPMYSHGPSLDRVAMIVVHSNPLDEPGSGDAGGMTVYVRELAGALASKGVVVDIYTRASMRTSGAWEPPSGVEVIEIEAGPLDLRKEEVPSHLPEFTARACAHAEARGLNYDLIHSHYWLSGRVASILSRRWDVPFVHTFHTLGRVKNRLIRPGDTPEPELRLNGEARVIAEADAIVASTVEERLWLIDLYGADPRKVTVVPPGVDHSLFYPGSGRQVRDQLGLGDAFTLMFVGRMQPLKAPDLAIRAMTAMSRAHRDVRLVLIGGASGLDGEEEPMRLMKLAGDLGVDDRICFVPAQPHPKLPDYYRAADVCLVPSHNETFGLVALEAQACGVPVIASDIGGLRSIVHDGVSGYLVDPGDPDVFANRAEKLYSDPQLHAAMSAAAVERSVTFSWRVSAQKLFALYSQVSATGAQSANKSEESRRNICCRH